MRVRQIGDEILHKKPKRYRFDDQPELQRQLMIMRSVLSDKGGVGIAANQCVDIEHPYQIIIIGTNDPKARALGAKRYPQREIPHEMVMINPNILSYETEVYYPGEGCLSIEGGLRAQVPRYSRVTVQFYDEKSELQEQPYHDFQAHIIQHEVDHLLGRVFLDYVIQELTPAELNTLRESLEIRLKNTPVNEAMLEQPVFAFKRDKSNHLYIDKEILTKILNIMDTTTLREIEKII